MKHSTEYFQISDFFSIKTMPIKVFKEKGNIDVVVDKLISLFNGEEQPMDKSLSIIEDFEV